MPLGFTVWKGESSNFSRNKEPGECPEAFKKKKFDSNTVTNYGASDRNPSLNSYPSSSTDDEIFSTMKKPAPARTCARGFHKFDDSTRLVKPLRLCQGFLTKCVVENVIPYTMKMPRSEYIVLANLIYADVDRNS